MDLRLRLNDFSDSLTKYPPKEHPAGQVADIFNALLAAVKEEHGTLPSAEATSTYAASDSAACGSGSKVAGCRSFAVSSRTSTGR